MVDLPTVVTQAGMTPQAPADLYAQILATMAVKSPGYTARLPGILIDDIAGTDVAAVALCDAARVETVDSLTPYGCNAWLLTQLGNIYGVKQGNATNTTVGVVFTGTPGFVIAKGFQVSDGTYAYDVLDGGIINSSGMSAPLTCVATVTGSFLVGAGAVTQIRSSVPAPYALTCVNPYAGTPGVLSQTETDYRTSVLRAGKAASQGMPSFLKTQLANVPGVSARLVSVQQVATGGWKVLVGGGDAYAVAYAIFTGMNDVSTLQPSVMAVTNITSAPNAVVTTSLNHGYSNGQTVYVNQVAGMSGINGLPLTVTVIDQKNFSTGVNTTLMGAYTSGGVVTPNYRNNQVLVQDYPDTYAVYFVSPPLQTVTIAVTWGTSSTAYVNVSAVAQLGAPALATYVNSIPVGQPMNLDDLRETFRDAVASVISSSFLTTLLFSVSINGIGTSAVGASNVIPGDPESYFQTDPLGSGIIVSRG